MKKIKDILCDNLCQVELNEKFYLFVEALDYDKSLLIELFDCNGEFFCNTLDLKDHFLTKNSTIEAVKNYGLEIIKKDYLKAEKKRLIKQGKTYPNLASFFKQSIRNINDIIDYINN